MVLQSAVYILAFYISNRLIVMTISAHYWTLFMNILIGAIPKCFHNWPDDDSMSRNMSPHL